MRESHGWFFSIIIDTLNNNNNIPMSSKEVWELNKHNYPGKGKTPEATLNSYMLLISEKSIYSNIKCNKNYKKYLKITQPNPIKFKLLDDYYEKEETIKEEPEKIHNDDLSKKIRISLTSKRLDWKCLTIYDDWSYEIDNIKNYTYVAEDLHEVKIGYTGSNPDKRMDQLKTANPNIKLLYVFPVNIERDLHKRFDHLRISGNREWFYPAKELKDYIYKKKEENNLYIDWYIKKIEIEQVQDKIKDKL